MPVTGLAIAGIGAGLQAGLGAYQAYKGNQQRDNLVRPVYEIPDEIKQNLTQSQIMALQGMPAQQRQNYLQQIAQSSQMGLRALSDRKAGIGGIGNIVQTENNANNNLLAQDSSARLANQLRLSAQRGIMAQYKDKQFNINQLQPYERAYGESGQMINAGMQNVGGALGTAANAGMSYGWQNAMPNNKRSPFGTNNPFDANRLNDTLNSANQQPINDYIPDYQSNIA